MTWFAECGIRYLGCAAIGLAVFVSSVAVIVIAILFVRDEKKRMARSKKRHKE